MNRNGGVIALTVVGVLVAGGIAAALNTVVLHGSTHASVGSAEQFLAAGLSPLDPSPSATPSAVPTEPSAPPTATEDSQPVSQAPVQSSSHDGGPVPASTPRATHSTARHATIAHVVSTPRPSPSPTEDHGGSSGGSGKSGSGSPSSGSGSGGSGSDD